MNSQGLIQEHFAFYKEHLMNSLLPFWEKALDRTNGGIYTCFDNSGEHLMSKDKFTWSQGRFLWLWSKLASLTREGFFSGDASDYLEQAHKTYQFLENHAFLENGHVAFLLSETGEKKEPSPGQGFDTSFYADCFVIMGYSEYARVTGEEKVYRRALAQHKQLSARLEEGSVRSEPYPIPAGYEAQGYAMLMLNTSQELADTAEIHGWVEAKKLRDQSQFYMNVLMTRFLDDENRLREVIPIDEHVDASTLLARHLNPGHTIECMWFVMAEAQKTNRLDVIERAIAAIKTAFSLGWDEKFGGLLRYVDVDGGPPTGRMTDDAFSKLVAETWDMKLWWPHSEALYSTLLGYQLTEDEDLWLKYRQTFDYTFRTFPHPDAEIGEWIQIRGRDGNPHHSVVALPVKDPYHIIRNVILIMELLIIKDTNRK